MVAYQDFVALSQSSDSEDRGRAAQLAAMAYLNHTGPADEHAALYAALIGFLDDQSVKVRAALAFGLLHAMAAPRPILLALMQDTAIIARAVAHHSPALIDADLLPLVEQADEPMLTAIATRERMSQRLAEACIARDVAGVTLGLLQRRDVTLSPAVLVAIAQGIAVTEAKIRGALFARADLPAAARLHLVGVVSSALRSTRIVKGAVAPRRLEKLLRDTADTAMTAIGEQEAALGRRPYAAALVAEERISARVMLHAIVNGHVLFLAECLAELAEAPREKVFTLLESGNRVALNALLARCGLAPSVRNMIARLIFHARAADLADDVASRHFVVTALTEELIVEHDGVIPPELEESFAYLSEQNVALARRAARGVMSAFAEDAEAIMRVPAVEGEERLALPAA